MDNRKKSIMDIVEEHLSPVSVTAGSKKRFGVAEIFDDGEGRAIDAVTSSLEFAGGLHRKASYVRRKSQGRKR